ncbi:hypothetical protein MSG28_005247 [Choristoneura fumiferana]|uniref:Uncharacterized protein n=1 Tax=Choristoneura fumiferana TaxID=7141 RepID=A0ACC0JR74_CHOFU|nr:hypothetical protein MSG28_005247 [Choristoneura fumiferana]
MERKELKKLLTVALWSNATRRLLQHAHCAPALCLRDYPTKLTPAHNYRRQKLTVAKEVEEHMLGWNIPEEHQDMVHEHWRNFPAVSKYWHYCLALIYTILMITSLTGNGIVIWIFGTRCEFNFAPVTFKAL